MKLLKLIAIFLWCRLVWTWFDLCGSDLGLGESLPFCIECSGLISALRIIILLITIRLIVMIVNNPPGYTQIYDEDRPPGQVYRIHWHRIALLASIVSYPLWVWWIDKNTLIPGPDSVWLIESSCHNPEIKGTFLWCIVNLFAVWGFRILHRD